MIESLENFFIKTYLFYKRWGEVDIFFTTSFVFGAASAAVVNLLIAITYFTTGIEQLSFQPKTTGIVLLAVLLSVIFYFNKRKGRIMDRINNDGEHPRSSWAVILFLLLIVAVWGFSGFLYRWRYLGY